MGEDITTNHGITIGLDVSDRFSEAYSIDRQGEWLESFRKAMQALAVCPPEKLQEEFEGRTVLELFAEETYGHYREHLAHLAAWRREMETTEA